MVAIVWARPFLLPHFRAGRRNCLFCIRKDVRSCTLSWFLSTRIKCLSSPAVIRLTTFRKFPALTGLITLWKVQDHNIFILVRSLTLGECAWLRDFSFPQNLVFCDDLLKVLLTKRRDPGWLSYLGSWPRDSILVRVGWWTDSHAFLVWCIKCILDKLNILFFQVTDFLKSN